MLTRKSRKEASIASPNDEDGSQKVKRSATPSKSKRSATPSKYKRSATPTKKTIRSKTPSKVKTSPSKTKRATTPRRSKSKSVERKLKTRSNSKIKVDLSFPHVILERDNLLDLSVENAKLFNRKKAAERSSNLKISPSPVKESDKRNNYFKDETNNIKVNESMSSRLIYDGSDDEPQLTNDKKIIKSPIEFGGSFGNIILIFILPVSVILAKIALKTKGNLIPFPRGYLRFSNYYDQDVCIWTVVIVVLQLLISLIPLARKTKQLNSSSKLDYYRFSGFINLIIGALIVAAMDYYKFPIHFIFEIVTKKTVPHIIVSVLCALIISIVVYGKARLTKQINELDSLNFLQKWFIGTTSYSTLGPINVKLALYRYSMLMTILFNYLVIVDSLKYPVNIYLYVVAGLQIFYALDKLVFEYHLLSSFYLQNEKDGFWTIIQQLLQPVIRFLPIQILLSNNLPVNNIILSITSVIFLVGFICQRYCDMFKYRHATNPHQCIKYSKYYNKLRSYIRYPNYIGTILVHLALILPTIELNLNSLQASWPVFLYPLYYIITLTHRCARINNYYGLNYGLTWEYQYAVKWNLIPKIF